MARAAVAQSQPSGKALPSLIAAGADSKQGHMARALLVNPTAMLLDVALPPRAKLIAAKCARDPAGVIFGRIRALDSFRKISENLKTIRGKWADALPEGSPARNLNLPLFHLVKTTFDYEDKTFVKELMLGMPIVGSIRARGC